jgi:hypothetical protein
LNRMTLKNSCRYWLPLSVGVACFLIFVLPWYLPPHDAPVVGASYALGFNNRIAILGLMAATFLGAILRIGHTRADDSLSWLREQPNLLPPLKTAGHDYAIIGAASLVMAFATMQLHAWLVNPYWGESGFFLSRIDLLDMGYLPYVDFHHNHGPLTLYAPLWLQRASQGSLGIEDAYAVCVAAGYVLGFVMLFCFAQVLAITGRARFCMLALSCLPWTCMTFGLNYVPLRFFVVPASLVVLDAVVKRRFGSPRAQAWCGALTATAGCFVSLGLSPEMGFASAAGMLAYATTVWRRPQPVLALALAGATLLTVISIAVAVPGYLLGVKAFASGSNNFPVYPNIHNCVFAFVCVCVMSSLIAASWNDPHDVRAPLAAALCAAGGLLIAPAFGRADPGHVIVNSVIPMTLMFCVAFHARVQFGWLWTALYALVAVVLIHISYWNHYAWLYREAHDNASLVKQSPHVLYEWQSQWNRLRTELGSAWRPAWSKPVPCPVGMVDLVSQQRVALPISSTQQIGLERLIKIQPRFRPLYHPIPVPELFSPVEADRTAREAIESDVVILPGFAKQLVEVTPSRKEYGESLAHGLSSLLLFPVTSPVVNEPFSAEREVCRRILASGVVISESPDAVLVRPEHAVIR